MTEENVSALSAISPLPGELEALQRECVERIETYRSSIQEIRVAIQRGYHDIAEQHEAHASRIEAQILDLFREGQKVKDRLTAQIEHLIGQASLSDRAAGPSLRAGRQHPEDIALQISMRSCIVKMKTARQLALGVSKYFVYLLIQDPEFFFKPSRRAGERLKKILEDLLPELKAHRALIVELGQGVKVRAL